MRLFLSTAACLALALPALAKPAATSITLKGATGEDIGTAILTAAPKGVLLRIEVKGLKSGWHGLHFHAKGDCSTPDFKSAGAHTHDEDGKAVHGLLNAEANETGDLPNLWVGADGTGKAEVFTTLVTLAGLKDADGSALVIHANADDHASQPIGGAGDRVACGVIK